MAIIDACLLLVDDNLMNSMLLSAILKKEGYWRVETFDNGSDALERMRDDAQPVPDLVMTDMNMPGISGIELCERIKADPVFAGIPVIMITASNMTETLERAFEAGVSDYVTLPFNARAILSRIKSVLRLREEMEKRQEHEHELQSFNQTLIEDLNVARRLQQKFLPETLVGHDVIISGRYMPVALLGGDLYYWEKLDDHRFCVFLLDIMGHGTAASMISMYLRSMLPELMKSGLDARGMMARLNRLMIELNGNLNGSEYHCTAQSMMADMRAGTLECISAGHPPVLLMMEDGSHRRLRSGCMPLGILDEIDIESDLVTLTDNTCALMYTDGLLDTLRDQGLDLDQLVSSFCDRRPAPVPGDIRGFEETDLIESLSMAVGCLPRDDDIALVQMKLFPGARMSAEV